MKLNDWRMEKEWTLQRLADELEVDISFVMRLIKGTRRPGPDLVEKIFMLTEGRVEPNDFYPLADWRAKLAALFDRARALLRDEAA